MKTINMNNSIKQVLLAVVCLFCAGTARGVDVTLTLSEGVERPAALAAAERNLAQVLTEINRAQRAHVAVSVRDLQMDDFTKKSLARLWAVSPFYCDEDEVVDRCWVFSNGTMMVRHIPLIMAPEDDSFGAGTYQEAVAEFDAHGRLTDFRFSLSAQMGEDMNRCGDVASIEEQHVIWQQIERFRTAYNTKDLQAIEDMFSDDALIITGRVVSRRSMSDSQRTNFRVEYTRQNKQQYISNLRKAFTRNRWIEVQFERIGDGDDNGCGGITRSKVNPHMYGVRLHQSWRSSNYSDEGFLFLLWEFPEGGGDPIIHVRTWEPEMVGGVRQKPNDDISTLGGFDL